MGVLVSSLENDAARGCSWETEKFNMWHDSKEMVIRQAVEEDHPGVEPYSDEYWEIVQDLYDGMDDYDKEGY